jgi:hypothetical protein
MSARAKVVGLALLAASSVCSPAWALDDDPLGLAAGARAVERAMKKGRQGMFTADWLPHQADQSRLSLQVLQFRGRGLDADLLSLSGRTRAYHHLWMSARISQPAARAAEASFGLNWETGPVQWSLTAATDRPTSNGLLPGADLSGTWRF